MANIFASIARKATTLSPMMEGRERMGIDELIANYPDGVTITAFDMISTGVDSYPVLNIAEDSNVNNIVHDWLEHFEGDIDTANNALAAAGGVRVKFAKSRTKSGNNLTTVQVLDD